MQSPDDRLNPVSGKYEGIHTKEGAGSTRGYTQRRGAGSMRDTHKGGGGKYEGYTQSRGCGLQWRRQWL